MAALCFLSSNKRESWSLLLIVDCWLHLAKWVNAVCKACSEIWFFWGEFVALSFYGFLSSNPHYCHAQNISHCPLEIPITEVALLEQEGYATDSLLLVCIILISSLWTSSATAFILGLKVLSCNLRCTSVSSFWISVKDTSLEKWQLTTCCCFPMDINKSGLLFFVLMIEGARVP